MGIMLTNGAVTYAKVTKVLVGGEVTKYLLDTPLVLRMAQARGPDGTVQEVMQPQHFFPTSTDDAVIEFKACHVMTTFPINEHILGMYQEVTGAIVTPPTQSLILPG